MPTRQALLKQNPEQQFPDQPRLLPSGAGLESLRARNRVVNEQSR